MHCKFPVVVNIPKDYMVAKMLYQPKYKKCVLKCQIVTSLLGDIIHASFPHLGTPHDSKIWDLTEDQHPMEVSSGFLPVESQAYHAGR